MAVTYTQLLMILLDPAKQSTACDFRRLMCARVEDYAENVAFPRKKQNQENKRRPTEQCRSKVMLLFLLFYVCLSRDVL